MSVEQIESASLKKQTDKQLVVAGDEDVMMDNGGDAVLYIEEDDVEEVPYEAPVQYVEENEVDQIIHNILNIEEHNETWEAEAKEAEQHPMSVPYRSAGNTCCGLQMPRLWEPVPRYTPEYDDGLKRQQRRVQESHTTMITSHFTARESLPGLAVVVHKTKGLPVLIESLVAPFVRVHVVSKRSGQSCVLPAQQLHAKYADLEFTAQPRVDAQISARCVLKKIAKEGTRAQEGQRVVYGATDADWSIRSACVEPCAWINDSTMQLKLNAVAGHHGLVAFPSFPLASALQDDCQQQMEVQDQPLHVKTDSVSPHRVLWGYLQLSKTVNMDALRSLKPGDSTFDTLCEGKWQYNVGHVKIALHEYSQPWHGDGQVPGVYHEYTALVDGRGKTTYAYLQTTVGGISADCLSQQTHSSSNNNDILQAMDASQSDEAQKKALAALNRLRASTMFHLSQPQQFRKNDVTVLPSAINSVCSVTGGRRGISSVTFSPNGRLLVVVGAESNNYSIKLYEHLPVHVLSPGATQESIQSLDGSSHIQWKLIKTLPGHSDYVYTCKFSACGTWLCTSSSDGFAKQWKVDSALMQYHSIWGMNPIVEMADSITRQSVQVRNELESMTAPYASFWHPVPVYSAVFITMHLMEDVEAVVLVTVGQDANIRFWHCESGEQQATVSLFSISGASSDEPTPMFGNLNHAINNANLTELLHKQTFTRENMLLLSDSNSVTSIRLNDVQHSSDQQFVCDNRGAVYILQDTLHARGFDPVFRQFSQLHTPQVKMQLAQMWTSRFKLVKTVHTGKPLTNLAVCSSRQCVIARTTKNCLVRISLTRLNIEREYGPIATNTLFSPLAVSPCERYVATGTATGSLVYVDLEKHYLLGNIAVSTSGLATKLDSALATLPTPQAPELPVNAVAWCPTMQILVSGVFGADQGAKLLHANKTPSQQVYQAYTKRNITGTEAFMRMTAENAWEKKAKPEPTATATTEAVNTVYAGQATIQTIGDELVHISYKDSAIAKERAAIRVNERMKLKYGLDIHGVKADAQMLLEDKSSKQE